MRLFLTLFLAALARGLAAKGFGLGLEAWLEARLPMLPHLACAFLALVLAVLAVEAAAGAAEAFWRGGEE